jgi:hypothetical protein
MKKYKVAIEPLTIYGKFIDIAIQGPAGTMRVKGLDDVIITLFKNKLQDKEAALMKGKWGFFGCEVRNGRKWFVKFVPISIEVQTVLAAEYKSKLAKKKEIED